MSKQFRMLIITFYLFELSFRAGKISIFFLCWRRKIFDYFSQFVDVDLLKLIYKLQNWTKKYLSGTIFFSPADGIFTLYGNETKWGVQFQVEMFTLVRDGDRDPCFLMCQSLSLCRSWSLSPTVWIIHQSCSLSPTSLAIIAKYIAKYGFPIR